MTVENTIARHKALVEAGNDKAADELKKHMINSPKYKGHKYLEQWFPKPKPKKKPSKK